MGKKIILFLIFTSLLALPLITLAVAFLPPPAGGADYSQSVENIINTFFRLIIWPIISFTVIILFIMAGFSFLTAQGEPSKLDQARKFLMWGIIGVIIILLAFSATVIIQNIIGLGG